MSIDGKYGVLKLAKAALEANAIEFLRLTEEVSLALEQEAGQVGMMRIRGKLITLPPEGDAVVVGDVHGDLESLVHILSDSNFVEKVRQQKNTMLIFLGDYGDRGFFSAEVYYVILQLKQRFPENVILMRGNHEGPEDLTASPHDLPFQLQQKFGKNGDAAYAKVRRLFDQLYNVVLVKDRYVLIHGGFPTKTCSLEDLAHAHEKHPREAVLEEMLWNDPEEGITGASASPRGAGKLFGEDVTKTFLKMLKVKVLIRGHEPSMEGFKFNHDGKVLTLFSRKGEPYHNVYGAYLNVNLALDATNVEKLVPWIRRF